MTRVLVNGAGGFIGGHLVKRLKHEGFWVRGVDLKRNEFSPSPADEFIVGDLRDQSVAAAAVRGVDDVYQLAADMGGAGYIFTGEHDAAVMHNSAPSTSTASKPAAARASNNSSTPPPPACIPNTTSSIPIIPNARKTPPIRPRPTANTAGRNCSANGSTSPTCATTAWQSASPASTTSSAPKAPGAAARKKRRPPSAARWPRPDDGGAIEIWGDGKQTRSFLYIDECVEGVRRLMRVRFHRPRQHRLRRDGHHQPARRNGHRHRRQAPLHPPHRRPPRRARAQFR